MSFPPTPLHFATSSQFTNLYAEPSYFTLEMGFNPSAYYPNAPVFDSFGGLAGSEAQTPNMAGSSAQSQLTHLVQDLQRDRGGPSSLDAFIDATKNVGPTSFGVLKIRNVSLRRTMITQPISIS
jgi:hypothetical protein